MAHALIADRRHVRSGFSQGSRAVDAWAGMPPAASASRPDDDLVLVTQNSRGAKKEKGLHRCNPLIVWRARQESNPRPPGS
jgi:hypothetical protein